VANPKGPKVAKRRTTSFLLSEDGHWLFRSLAMEYGKHYRQNVRIGDLHVLLACKAAVALGLELPTSLKADLPWFMWPVIWDESTPKAKGGL
jgi:hypothetical protein